MGLGVEGDPAGREGAGGPGELREAVGQVGCEHLPAGLSCRQLAACLQWDHLVDPSHQYSYSMRRRKAAFANRHRGLKLCLN